jgi:hypothetical protein
MSGVEAKRPHELIMVPSNLAHSWSCCPKFGLCDAGLDAWTFVCCLAASGKANIAQAISCWRTLSKSLGFVEALPHQHAGGVIAQQLGKVTTFETELGLVMLGPLRTRRRGQIPEVRRC